MPWELTAAGASLVVVGLLFAVHLQGALSRNAFVWTACAVLVAALAFHGAFRTRLDARVSDPGLTGPQMIAGTVVILCAMYASEGARGVVIVFVLMAFMFGSLRLSPRTLMLHAFFILGAYGLVIVCVWAFGASSRGLGVEVLQWFALAISLPWFARMAAYVRQLRCNDKERNADLEAALAAARDIQADLTRARDASAAAKATLDDAIETLTEAFALFDADDRLACCNSRYAQMFTGHADVREVIGKTFADVVLASVANGEVIEPEFRGDVAAWVEERVRRHRNPGTKPYELQLGDGRWLQVMERRTSAGGLVGVRRDITEWKQLEQRQAIAYTVTRLLAESETVNEAVTRIMHTLGDSLHWDCAARWYWDAKDHELRCAETWGVGSVEISSFLEECTRTPIAPDSLDVARRAWTALKPLWLEDLAKTPPSPRASLAVAAGLRSALFFPIVRDDGPYGVMEFYSRALRTPDASLLAIAETIGMQIGQFITRKDVEDKIRQLALYDPLTGLPNRNLFNTLFDTAIARAQRRKSRIGLMLVDLDGFKSINDTHGHDAGDHLLKLFAVRLAACIRNTDVVGLNRTDACAARLGGDEFVVMLEDVESRSDLAGIAERIIAAGNEPFDLAGPKERVSASIGMALYPDDASDIPSLLKRADAAMYRAKQAGKNQHAG